ncbi:hypothetical protein [Stenotrophomonas indicatrix]|uniref:hypothetical protein n=1 Tax=Stenotrophomonas indicatrix TaxID=2045451 RepID=UPI0013FD5783|nr:hypothetical protein [Stenotrophomonas indicatrix]
MSPLIHTTTLAQRWPLSNYMPTKTPRDLAGRRIISIRLPTYTRICVWDFERAGLEQNVRVEGQVIFNASHHIIAATLNGLDVAFLPEDEFAPHIESTELV